jgi:G3E family GTPase
MFPGTVDLEKVDEWLRDLLWENKIGELICQNTEILRVKMLLNAQETDQKVIFQAVRELYDKQEGNPWGIPREQRKNRLVFIGRS